ncbi:NAD(P)-dependent oxidoreductase [Nocardia cyriacigeorgica]|uniref:NAD(P)-dependent oxidoreductase n=1 Tax=Nocardia cyriacigeorgica TaxID=135487 RepID=UPI002457923B|nr:NAD(P)-binding domain-containing protein [Nocardia cyriacigeorgica]
MSGNDKYAADVSVIGLGQLGTRLAEAFRAADQRTAVWNRTAAAAEPLVARGAIRADSVADAIGSAPVVVVCLPDYDTVRAVLAPHVEQLRGRVLVNLTSGTPQEGRDLAARAAAAGAGYLDGAAMSGTKRVGQRDALFVFSGATDAFDTHRSVLASLGNAVHLGTDPGLAAVYDTALFAMAWGALAGFYHAVALTDAADIEPAAFAQVATGHLPFIGSLMIEHADQIAAGVYPNDDGTVAVHAAAIDHLVASGADQHIHPGLPELIRALLARAESAGHGADGIASVAAALRSVPADV